MSNINHHEISNDTLFSTVFEAVFEALDGFDVDSDIIAKGCAEVARTIRERSQYERQNYYHNVSAMIEHLRHDPDLRYLHNHQWSELETLAYDTLPTTSYDSSSQRAVIGNHCFVIEHLSKVKPIEVVYYSTK